MERNKKSLELNKKHPLLSLNLLALGYFGLWPFQDSAFLENEKRRKIHFLYGFAVYIMFIVFVTTLALDLITVWGNLDEMTSNMPITFVYMLGVFKIFTFFGHRRKMESLFSRISRLEINIWRSGDEKIKQTMFEYIIRAKNATIFFWVVIVTTMWVFFLTPPIEYRYSSIYHRVYDNGSEYWSYVRPMIFNSWFPFDKYAFPNFYFAYTYQIMMGVIGTAYHASWDMLIISMMIHTIGQLQILQISFKNATAGSEDDAKHRRLVDCVYHHRYIMSYTREVNALVKPVMLLYFLLFSTTLCACAYQATLVCLLILYKANGVISELYSQNGLSIRLYFMLEFILALTVQLFLFYWHGNEVIFESENLLLSTYSCEWYNESRNFKKSLWIIRQGIKLPIKFTIGSFYAMSLPTFLSVLKSSYSFYAVLRQVVDEKYEINTNEHGMN